MRASNQSEAVWACLHGELTGDERSTFEQDLQADAALRRTFDDAARLDRLLRVTLPGLDQAESSIDDVAEQALACWERTYDSEQKPVLEHIRHAGGVVVQDSRFEKSSVSHFSADNDKSGIWSYDPARFRRLFSHPLVGVTGLAAAAIILLTSPVLRSPDGLVWDDQVFAPLVLRGVLSPEEQGILSDDTAVRCQTLLQAELTRALAARMDSVQTPLVVSLHLQELRNGAFSLSVQVRTRKGEAVGAWSGDYSGEAAFKEQVGASAAHMAEALAFWPHAVKGRQP